MVDNITVKEQKPNREKVAMKGITMRMGLIFIFIGIKSLVLASSGTDDLIKMAGSGVDEEVLQSYIESSPDTYDLSADEIITLKDLGVSSKVISEALRHGNEIDSATAHKTIKEAMSDTGETSQALSTTAAVAPPPDNLNISFFYKSLYPYGNWLMIDGDWCWQPNATVINGDWAPYSNQGHWVYSDWGWCWVSDYSWGWAPFHYGRWLHHQGYGWCWVPDTDWGPAWVAWRNGNGYCGWAPLPPHSRYVNNSGFYFGASLVGDDFEFNLTSHDYHFLPIGRFGDPHPWRHTLSSDRGEEAYGKTSFVRNGYGFDHGHIFNHGLPVNEVSKASGKNIRSITVVQETVHPGQPIERGIVRENRLLIYKPIISPTVPETPAIIKSRFTKVPAGIQSGNKAGTYNEKARRENAVRTTIKNERLAAEAAQRERADLEKKALSEANIKRRAELQKEAEGRAMREQRANEHVARMKQLKEPETLIPLPQSRVIPAPSSDNRERIKRQVQAQVRDEARMEGQVEQSRDERSPKPTLDNLPQHREPPVERSNSESNRERKKSGQGR